MGKGSLFFPEHVFLVWIPPLLSFNLVYSVLTKAEEVPHASQVIFKKKKYCFLIQLCTYTIHVLSHSSPLCPPPFFFNHR